YSRWLLLVGMKQEIRNWWQIPLDTLCQQLQSNAAALSAAEARARLKRYGPNRFIDRPERSLLVEFLSRFCNPLVLILIAASVISAFTGEVGSFVIIVLMVTMSVSLDFVQEYRAGRAAEQLRQSVQIHATVVRDGTLREVPVIKIVPGDVVRLSAGSMVPAD